MNNEITESVVQGIPCYKGKCRQGSSEGAEQATVVQYCVYNGYPVVHTPNEGKRSVYEGRKQKAQGLATGFPDLSIPVPNAYYHGLYIEMKHGVNKPSNEQIKWLQTLSANGYKTAICYEADAAIKVIGEYMSEPKEPRCNTDTIIGYFITETVDAWNRYLDDIKYKDKQAAKDAEKVLLDAGNIMCAIRRAWNNNDTDYEEVQEDNE